MTLSHPGTGITAGLYAHLTPETAHKAVDATAASPACFAVSWRCRWSVGRGWPRSPALGVGLAEGVRIDRVAVICDLAGGWIAASLATDPGYRAIQQIPGVGPTWAAVFVAEIGDVTRFASPRHLCSWDRGGGFRSRVADSGRSSFRSWVASISIEPS